jgi:hypothetical protein
MSSTLHFALLRDPKLVDVVDEEWEKEVLPVDGAIALIESLHNLLLITATLDNQLNFFFSPKLQTPFYLTGWIPYYLKLMMQLKIKTGSQKAG